MKNHLSFIVVDDEPISNVISMMIIKATLPKSEVKLFNIPEDALAYLENQHINLFGTTILLLDITMPGINGWEFLDIYEKFNKKLNLPVSIYMLTSSVDQRDKEKALAHKNVRGFISKPLDRATVNLINNSISVNT